MKSLNTTFENQQKKEANKQQKVTPLKFNIDTKHGHTSKEFYLPRPIILGIHSLNFSIHFMTCCGWPRRRYLLHRHFHNPLETQVLFSQKMCQTPAGPPWNPQREKNPLDVSLLIWLLHGGVWYPTHGHLKYRYVFVPPHVTYPT